MNMQAFLLHTSPLFTALVPHPCPITQIIPELCGLTSILTSTSTLERIFIMATKSFLLSCLLMGLGVAQHPTLEGTQTQATSIFTVPAGFATSIDPPLPPEEWGCQFSPEDLTKYKELHLRVEQMPTQLIAKCLIEPGAPDTPECEPLKSFVDFLSQKCSNMPPGYLLSNIFEDVNADTSDSWSVGSANYAMLDNNAQDALDREVRPTFTSPADFAASTPPVLLPCDLSPEDVPKFTELFHRKNNMSDEDWMACTPSPTVPHIPECEPLHELWDFLVQKCLGPQGDVLSNIIERVNADSRDSWTIEPADHSSFSLEQRSADEPYHSALKPIYDDCDVLEDPEEDTTCVLAELERALCEQEPWIPLCRDSESGRADGFSPKSNIIDNDLLDEIFDTDGVAPVADNNDLPRRPQVTAAPEATKAARPIEWFPWLGLEPFYQECEHADGLDSLEDCVYEKMREEVCSSNPGDESCQVPRATLIYERDLPLHTKAADLTY